MHTLPAPPFKGMGKLIHIAAWAILFGLPFFFTGRESQTVTVLSYIRSIIVPLSFMLVFYANYSVLIDHFLFAKRPWKYFLYNVVLIAFAMGAVHLIFELLPHPRWEHPRPEREWQEIVGFFMVNAMLYMLVAGLSVAIKMTGSWYQMESSRRELEKSRAEAELQNLKSQLNPHFLFNTLHLQSDRFQPRKSARSRARPKPPAPLRALRQQPADGSVREGTRLYPELCGTDAYTPAGTCETDHRHIGCHTRNSGGASPLHLPDRKCFQAWGKPQQTFFYRPEDSPGRDTDRLLYPQQRLPERQRTGQERFRHWAAESQQAVGIAVSVASYFHVRAKRRRICLPVRIAGIRIYCIFVRYINTTNYDVNMCNHR